MAIVQSLTFDPSPLSVSDQIKGVSLPWKQYERKYAHGLFFRTDSRWFVATIIANKAEEATALGVAERVKGETVAIHGIFYNGYLTNKEQAYFLLNYIYDELGATDFGFIRGLKVNTGKVDLTKFTERLRIHPSNPRQAEEAVKLAESTLQRRTDIVEYFDEPIKYKREEQHEHGL
ncbi:hypothetical protein [Gracilibacillus timonensis]|uniref:hypothetical protein n=1 Tax=Gracilibacillus timonensis TaxID=1816696 RepID=UPI0011DD5D49|nr:hypothetical protein [Gracilibacillus timonensis]